ncbi:MAG: hypothetical protein K0R03_206 [Moraxellaceae bacterium]|jgi:hypothetical protein|nr:hypothetical protein [Moraxellaceae bacterium]
MPAQVCGAARAAQENATPGILRRHGDALSRTDRELLHELIGEYGQHLVQLNRLIQVNQLLR